MSLHPAIITVLLLLLDQCAGYNPATDCQPAQCQLPDCMCAGSSVPGGLDPADIPQIVTLSFHSDALESTNFFPFYEPLFGYTNPNGCNIGITFFVPHEYTDYVDVNKAYNLGHEIGSNSITLTGSQSYWMNLDYQGWISEMYGQKQILSNFANIPLSDITGARAYGRIEDSDTIFSALDDTGFLYDSSMSSSYTLGSTLWPFTLDSKSPDYWSIPSCPTNSYPGFWEVPLGDYIATDGTPCVTLDSCPSFNTTNSTFDFLLNNFNTHYQGNRAPFSVATRSSWFYVDPNNYPAYVQFIEYLVALPGVYIVTETKALQWMQQPTKLSNIAGFEPWLCDSLPDAKCSGILCYYATSTPGGERYMNSCADCPPNYPWVNDPYGNVTVTGK